MDRSDDGAALVEFTILMPVFFLILFGIVEFGSMLWLQNNMTNAAREGARRSSVQGGTLQQANLAACQALRGAGQTFSITSTDLCNASQDVRVDVSLSKANASLFNTFFFVDNNGSLSTTTWGGTIGASVTMRKEFTCTGTQAAVPCSCDTSGNSATGC